MAKLKITQVRSTINEASYHKKTMASLGLRKIDQSVEHEDVPSIKGMIAKVGHLITVEEI